MVGNQAKRFDHSSDWCLNKPMSGRELGRVVASTPRKRSSFGHNIELAGFLNNVA
jgi:hypothetical protein